MVTWRVGRSLLALHFEERSESLDRFIAAIGERCRTRIPGTMVILTAVDGVPPAMRRVAARFHSLAETVVLLTVLIEHTPRIDSWERVKRVVALPSGFHQLTLHYGFMDQSDVHGDLALVLPTLGIVTPSSEVVYVVGRETFVASEGGRMGPALESIFAFLSRNSKSATDYFQLPPEQVVEIGAQIDL
jgi:KUP system potassium uptake protein